MNQEKNLKDLENLEIKINCDITIDNRLHDEYDYMYIVHNIIQENEENKMSTDNYI